MQKIIFPLRTEHDQRVIIDRINFLGCDENLQVTIEPIKRTLGNNAHQWPILSAFSSQLLWPVNGKMCKLDAEEWKDILTSAYKQETVKLAMGINGGVVMLGKRTRDFKKAEWPEWIAFLEWAAAEKGVKIPISKSQCEAWGV